MLLIRIDMHAATHEEQPLLVEQAALGAEFELHSLWSEKKARWHLYRGIRRRDALSVVIKTAPLAASEALLNEARRVVQLSHPHMVRLVAQGRTKLHQWAAYQYFPGTHLDAACSDPRFSVAARVNILLQLSGVLERCHQEGYIHGALQPRHILVSRGGNIRLLDFESGTPGGRILVPEDSSELWFAPEVRNQFPVSHGIDLFGLGALAYKMLSGQSPFGQGETQSIHPFRSAAAQVPMPPPFREALHGLIHSCLAIQVSDRPVSMRVFRETLQEIAARYSVLPQSLLRPSKSSPLGFIVDGPKPAFPHNRFGSPRS